MAPFSLATIAARHLRHAAKAATSKLRLRPDLPTGYVNAEGHASRVVPREIRQQVASVRPLRPHNLPARPLPFRCNPAVPTRARRPKRHRVRRRGPARAAGHSRSVVPDVPARGVLPCLKGRDFADFCQLRAEPKAGMQQRLLALRDVSRRSSQVDWRSKARLTLLVFAAHDRLLDFGYFR